MILGFTMQSNVSLAVIIKNSEDCIDTFFSWAVDNFEEINVVLDTENDDNTAAKCLFWDDLHGSINLVRYPFDNFSAQWNRAIEMSTKPYCIYMGCDEILEEVHPEGIENFMKRTNADVGVLPRYNLQRDDEHYNAGGYPDNQLRVIRMDSGIRMNGKVVDETLGTDRLTMLAVLPWNIIHYGQIRNDEALKQKGIDRLPFAEADGCDGSALLEHGDNWFIHRNVEWNKDENLFALPKHILKQSRKYWK